ncbi:MAG TPA: FkbM family methyltransferase [Alphaproteobacteria bacterium]
MDPVQQYFAALNRVGILNYQNMQVTGEEYFLRRYLSRASRPVVFDVGANRGEYSRVVLDVCPSARIFAFEPHPVTFNALQQNLGNTGAALCQYGLGDVNATTQFYDYRDADGSSHASLYKDVIERVHGKPAICHDVLIRKLDDVVADLGLERINLLKVDTEGHEMAVFIGGERTIRAGLVDVIQFEFNETNVVARTFFKDFWDFLRGYRFYRLLPNGTIRIGAYWAPFCEVFAFQNIVCVRNGLSVFE